MFIEFLLLNEQQIRKTVEMVSKNDIMHNKINRNERLIRIFRFHDFFTGKFCQNA